MLLSKSQLLQHVSALSILMAGTVSWMTSPPIGHADSTGSSALDACISANRTLLAHGLKYEDWGAGGFDPHLLGQLVASLMTDDNYQKTQPNPITWAIVGDFATSVCAEYSYFNYIFIAEAVLHGAIWYLGGKRMLSWDQLEILCPNGAYEGMQTCLHGLGHAGVYAVAEKTFNPCQTWEPDIAQPAVLMDAYNLYCAIAPSSFLAFMCANGFYHGVHHHFAATSWQQPCDTKVSFPQLCFHWLFYSISQADDTVNNKWILRRDQFDEAGSLSVCSQLEDDEDMHLACVWGLASYTGYADSGANPHIADKFGVAFNEFFMPSPVTYANATFL